MLRVLSYFLLLCLVVAPGGTCNGATGVRCKTSEAPLCCRHRGMQICSPGPKCGLGGQHKPGGDYIPPRPTASASSAPSSGPALPEANPDTDALNSASLVEGITQDRSLCMQIDGINIFGASLTLMADVAVSFDESGNQFDATLKLGGAGTIAPLGSVYVELSLTGTYAIIGDGAKTMKGLLKAVVKNALVDPIKRWLKPPAHFEGDHKDALKETLAMYLIPAGGRGGVGRGQGGGADVHLHKSDQIAALQKDTDWSALKQIIQQRVRDFLLHAIEMYRQENLVPILGNSRPLDAEGEWGKEHILEMYKKNLVPDCSPPKALTNHEQARILLCVFVKSGIFTENPWVIPMKKEGRFLLEADDVDARFPPKNSDEEKAIALMNIQVLFPELVGYDWLNLMVDLSEPEKDKVISRMSVMKLFAQVCQPFDQVAELKDLVLPDDGSSGVRRIKGHVGAVLGLSVGTFFGATAGTYGCTPDTNAIQASIAMGFSKTNGVSDVHFDGFTGVFSSSLPSGQFQITLMKTAGRGPMSYSGQMRFAIPREATAPDMSNLGLDEVIIGLYAALGASSGLILAMLALDKKTIKNIQDIVTELYETYEDTLKKLKQAGLHVAGVGAAMSAAGAALDIAGKFARLAQPVSYSVLGRFTVNFVKEWGKEVEISFSHDIQYGVGIKVGGVAGTPGGGASVYYFRGTTYKAANPKKASSLAQLPAPHKRQSALAPQV